MNDPERVVMLKKVFGVGRGINLKKGVIITHFRFPTNLRPIFLPLLAVVRQDLLIKLARLAHFYGNK